MADQFAFDAARFMWVRRGVSRNSPRHYLEGVRVEPRPEGGAHLVATDGHVLFCAVDPSAECPRPAIIDVTVCDGAFDDDEPDPDESPRRDWTGMRLRFALGAEDDSAAVATFDLPNSPLWFAQGVARTVTGLYPNWRECLSRPERAAPGLPILNPRLIMRAAFGDGGVVIVQRGGATAAQRKEPARSNPSIIVPTGAPWGFVVVMPMTLNAERTLPPDALARAMFDPADLEAITGGGGAAAP